MSRFFRRLQTRLRYWRQRDERHRLLQEEMQFHLDSLADDFAQNGVAASDARAAARRKFGNPTQQAEESRSTWIARWLSDAAQDLRYSVRTLRREAGFTTFALLIVGLGIGASSTIFSVVNALLLRPLPFRDPSRLVWVANGGNDGDLSGQTTQVSHLLDIRAHSRSFSDLAAYFAFYGVGDTKLTGTSEPERLSGVPVTQNFFPLLGIQPYLGRLFTAEECKYNGPSVVLLNYGLWKRRFASDPAIVGKTLVLNDAPATVVGVMPASFDFASVFAPASRIDLYFPFPLSPETNRQGNTLAIIGRLKPGATVQAAQSEVAVLASVSRREHPELNYFVPRLSSLEQHVSGHLRPALLVLICAVGVVMLIVCANLSNLQLARTASRRKEMAVRAAIGAGRQRLIRQMLTENVVLACGGALLGTLLAVAGTRALSHLDSVSIPLLESVRVDLGSLSFTLLIAVFTGLLFGLIPALQVPSITVHDVLKDSARGSSEGNRYAWARNAIVVAEIALACVLLVGSGLLIRSFLRVLDVNLGFRPERAASLRIDPGSQYSDQKKRNAYFVEALRLARDIPGVQAAGLTDVLPLGVNRSWGIAAKGHVYTKDDPQPDAFVRVISPGYLSAMGIPLRAGRDLTARDNASGKPVILINQTLARRLFPGQEPLGQSLTADVSRQVVGIVGDVRHVSLEQGSGSEMYLPILQSGDYSSVDLVVRTALPAQSLTAAVRAALRPIEPNLPTNDFRTLQQLVDKSVSPRRFLVWLLAGFAAFALVLASLGIYAVISYSVNQRTQEIGIRMALGASAADLQRRILSQTLTLTAIGMAIGVVASWLLARALSSLLFGVTAADPATFLAMLAVLTVVAALAGYLPARRASRIEPMLALRSA